MRRSSLLLSLAALAACSDYKLSTSTEVVGEDDGGRPEDQPPGDDLSCGTWDPGADYAISTVDDCLREPELGTFDPVVEWSWSVNPVYSGYEQNMSTPVVANLNDDNGDGTVNADDIPDIVFTSYSGSAYSSPGTLTAISGDGSGTHWSVADLGGIYPYGSGGVAAADLDGDGLIEVCVAGSGAAVICVAGEDGSLLWSAGVEENAYGHPAIADLDGDGLAEVIFGRQIFAYDGTVIGVGDGGTGGSSYMSFAVDWDGDGQLEVIAGSNIYALDGTTTWADGRTDGYPAVGDFDSDGRPDLVRVAGDAVSVVLNDGTLLWETPVPGGGGGAPTVADLDGDGRPEVGVAGFSYYSMFDTDGAVVWSNLTEDDSSSVTGSSVFDFEGDGRAEIVYADEHNLYVYDGANGTVLLQDADHASGTLFEYPVIADVDGDGATEVVVSSNNMWWEGWNGVTVLGSESSSWAPARPIWNQFAYHITNVQNDGTIPAVQTENWQTWNSFRAGGTELGPSHWLADLQDGGVETCLDDCDIGSVQLAVSVENEGLLAALGVTLSLRAGAPSGPEIASQTLTQLDAGGGRWSTIFAVSDSNWRGDLFLVIDGDEAVDECDETDNILNLGPWPCG